MIGWDRHECLIVRLFVLPLKPSEDTNVWLKPECTCTAAERLTAYLHLTIQYLLIFNNVKNKTNVWNEACVIISFFYIEQDD